MFKLENIEKVYKMEGGTEVRAVDNISLHIEKGDFVALVGASGSGKSSLLNILGCLDSPSAGSYRVNGEGVATLNDEELSRLRSEKFGFIFQKFNLLPSLSSLENIELPLLYRSNFTPTMNGSTLLTRVGLGERANHRPSELSGGQQQRVAIARALIGNPEVIFADEPTGNLDSESTEEILALLYTLNKEGRTIIMVTHDLEIANQAKRVIRIHDGKIASDERREPLSFTTKTEEGGEV